MPHLDFPYRIDGRGRSAQADDAGHIRDLIEQLLLTAPGERVMRPDFGGGLLHLLFEPNGSMVSETAQTLVHAGLQEHLAHMITVEQVQVLNLDSTLQVAVDYRLRRDGSAQRAVVAVPGSGA